MFISGIAASTTIFGQQSEAERLQQEREISAQQRKNEELNARIQNQITKQRTEVLERSRQKNVETRRMIFKRLSKKEQKKILNSLAPSPEDLAKYSEFLKQPNAGIFRLLPNRNCNQKYVVDASVDCQNAAFVGEFYSFQDKEYADQDFFDLTFKNGEFATENGLLTQTILIALGDIPLENVSPLSNGVKTLFDFKPATEIKEVQSQHKMISDGFDFEGYKYAKSDKAQLNTTYALRSIAYTHEIKTLKEYSKYGVSKKELDLLMTPTTKREDVIIAFRLVREDKDGSVIILWKELSRQKSPKITFSKRKKSSN